MSQRFARIDASLVAEIIELPEGFTLEDCFPAIFLQARIIPAPAEVDQGWSFSDGRFTPPAPFPGPDAEQARSARQALLAGSDWAMMPDSPLDDDAKKMWRQYRQALRDVPKQKGFPASISWPPVPVTK